MINLFRWIVALPLGVLAAFAAQMFLAFTFSIAHGFEEVAVFWESQDMAGMPISGTYMILTTRIFGASMFVGVTAWVVPKFKKQVGFTLATIVSVIFIALLIYLLYASFRVELILDLSAWYRNILETASIILGCVAGAGVSSGLDKTKSNLS